MSHFKYPPPPKSLSSLWHETVAGYFKVELEFNQTIVPSAKTRLAPLPRWNGHHLHFSRMFKPIPF